MKQRFLNAVLPTVAGVAENDDLLLSYYHWRTEGETPTARLVAGDSGGYSVASVGAVLDPRDVILWQIKNTHIGYILDRPPYNASSTKGTARLDRRLWPGCLRSTVRNVHRAKPYYRPNHEEFRWWGIIQGATREDHEEWYGEVADAYPFDGEGEGWAMRPYPNSNLRAIARCVRFAADKRIRNLHLLQTTGARAVAVLLGLSQLSGLELVTYDSASAARLSSNMWCLIRPETFPMYDRDVLREVTAKGDTDIQDYMRSGECPCAGCTGFPSVGAPQGTAYFNRLYTHNLGVMRDNFTAIAAMAEKGPEALVREAADFAADDVLRAFEASAS